MVHCTDIANLTEFHEVTTDPNAPPNGSVPEGALAVSEDRLMTGVTTDSNGVAAPQTVVTTANNAANTTTTTTTTTTTVTTANAAPSAAPTAAEVVAGAPK
jgi:hypothetical protein